MAVIATARRRILAAATMSAVLLSGCGTGSDDPLVSALRGAVSSLTTGADDAEPDFRSALTRDAIDALGRPLILAELVRTDSAALFTSVGENGGVVTWRSNDDRGFALSDGGLLRSTRGFGSDLMSSDLSETAAAIRDRRDAYVVRDLVHLDGEYLERRSAHRCQIGVDGRDEVEIVGRTYPVTLMREICTADVGTYENLYWVGADGRLRESVQWISPDVGHIRFRRLAD